MIKETFAYWKTTGPVAKKIRIDAAVNKHRLPRTPCERWYCSAESVLAFPPSDVEDSSGEEEDVPLSIHASFLAIPLCRHAVSCGICTLRRLLVITALITHRIMRCGIMVDIKQDPVLTT